MQKNFIDLIRSAAQEGVSDLHLVRGKIYRRFEGSCLFFPPALNTLRWPFGT